MWWYLSVLFSVGASYDHFYCDEDDEWEEYKSVEKRSGQILFYYLYVCFPCYSLPISYAHVGNG